MHIRVDDHGIVHMNMLDTGEEAGVGVVINRGTHGPSFVSLDGLAYTIEELNTIIDMLRNHQGAYFNVQA